MLDNSLRFRWSNIIDKFSICTNEMEFTTILSNLTHIEHPTVVSFVNTNALNIIVKNKAFYANIMASDIVFRDGAGVFFLLKRLGIKPGLNLNGTDVIPKIIQQFSRSRKIALYGTTNDCLSAACQKIKADHAGIDISSLNGYLPFENYVESAQQNRPELIILGMGMPKQEELSMLLKSKLDYPVVIVNGGAVLDFIGYKVKRAPRILRSLGLEWLFRLALEPRRLFKRYVLGNPLFLFRTLKFKKQKT